MKKLISWFHNGTSKVLFWHFLGVKRRKFQKDSAKMKPEKILHKNDYSLIYGCIVGISYQCKKSQVFSAKMKPSLYIYHGGVW